MAKTDGVQSAFERARNFVKGGFLGDKGFGHFSLTPMAADPTATAFEGRFWFKTAKARLYFQGLAKAATTGTLQIPGALTGSKTFDWASVADGAQATTTVTVTNAEVGDFCLASVGVTQAGVILHAYVSAGDTATVVLQNESGGAVDLASTTLRAVCFKAT